MKNKIVQFFKMIFYNFKSIDNEFLMEFLNEEEIKLIKKLKKSELYHSILVAKGVKNDINNNDSNILNKNNDLYIKASLFHDIGKIEYQINIIEKTIATIIKKIYKNKVSLFNKYEFYKSYLYHGERGSKILKKKDIFKENNELYDVIAYHHKDINKLMEIKKYSLKTLFFFKILQINDDNN